MTDQTNQPVESETIVETPVEVAVAQPDEASRSPWEKEAVAKTPADTSKKKLIIWIVAGIAALLLCCGLSALGLFNFVDWSDYLETDVPVIDDPVVDEGDINEWDYGEQKRIEEQYREIEAELRAQEEEASRSNSSNQDIRAEKYESYVFNASFNEQISLQGVDIFVARSRVTRSGELVPGLDITITNKMSVPFTIASLGAFSNGPDIPKHHMFYSGTTKMSGTPVVKPGETMQYQLTFSDADEAIVIEVSDMYLRLGQSLEGYDVIWWE